MMLTSSSNTKESQEEERQILLAAQIREVILNIFRETGFLTERVTDLFAERERLAASLVERKRFMCVQLFNEQDEIHQNKSNNKDYSPINSDNWKNTSSIKTQTEGKVSMMKKNVSFNDNDDNDDDGDEKEVEKQDVISGNEGSKQKEDKDKQKVNKKDQNEDPAAVSSPNKKLQSSEENDPDVEKTVKLLSSIRDLLQKKYIEEQEKHIKYGENFYKEKGDDNDDENNNSENKEPGHIEILRQLGFDVSQFDTSPLNSAKHTLEEERKRKERMKRMKQEDAEAAAKATPAPGSGTNIWAQASKIVLSSSSDDDDQKDKNTGSSLLENRRKRANTSLRRQLRNSENESQEDLTRNNNDSNTKTPSTTPSMIPLATSMEQRKKDTVAAAGRSRVLALVSALQFQATASALGEREAQRRNFIMLDAFHGGWECYRQALDEIADRSLFTDYVAAKRNHDIVVSPGRRGDGYPHLPSNGVNNTNYSNNNNDFGVVHPVHDYNRYHHQNMNNSSNNSGRMSPSTTTPPPPAASSSSVEKKLELYKTRKGDSPYSSTSNNNSRKTSPTVNKNNHNTPSSPSISSSALARRRASSPNGNRTAFLSKNNNNNEDPTLCSSAKTHTGFLDAWKNAQSNRPGDFKGQLEALKREIARRPTPTRAAMLVNSGSGNRNEYLENEVPTFIDTTPRLFESKKTNSNNTKKNSSSSTSPSPIRRDSNGKIILSPSSSRSRRRGPSNKTKTSSSLLDEIDDELDHHNNNNESETDESLDEDEKIQIAAANQTRKSSPSYSPQQRAAARKHQQIFDADRVKDNQKKQVETSKAIAMTMANRNRSINNRFSADEDDEDSRTGRNSINKHKYAADQLGVGSWMQISDGDVRLTWTRRFLRWDPSTKRIYFSAREGIVGKAMIELVDPQQHEGLIELISVKSQHAQIISPFNAQQFVVKHSHNNKSSKSNNNLSAAAATTAATTTCPKFYLLNVSQDHFYGHRGSSFSSGGGAISSNGVGASSSSAMNGFVLLEPPDPNKNSKNGVTLTLQSFVNPNVLITIVFCAETQVHAVMWSTALKVMQIDSEISY